MSETEYAFLTINGEYTVTCKKTSGIFKIKVKLQIKYDIP